jgi:hypothetical protein
MTELTGLAIIAALEDHQIKAYWEYPGYVSVPAGKVTLVLNDNNENVSIDVIQIRTAYRSAARTHHPDRGGDPAKFRRMQAAYEVLEARYGR